MPISGENQDIPKLPACVWCREKKIRCGREKPQCKNCVHRGTQCTYSDRPKRENEYSRHAHLFEEIHTRLDRMETTMARIAAALEIKHEPALQRRPFVDYEASPNSRRPDSYRESFDSASEAKSSPGDKEMDMTDMESDSTRLGVRFRDQGVQARSSSLLSGRSLVEDGEGNAYYHGGTSFLAISSEAAEGAEAAGRSPAPSATAAMPVRPTDLIEIQENVGRLLDHHSHVTVLAHPATKSKDRKFWVPPRQVSIKIIDGYFESPAWIFPLYIQEEFMRRVDAMYANLDAAVDMGWLICYLQVIVFGIYGALNDKDEVAREYAQCTERIKIMQKASKVVWDCLEDTAVLLEPKLLNVKALMMMAAVANEISRPGLCWLLVCNAAAIAKTIGLHRSHITCMSKFTPTDIAERKYVFWTLYIMDKSLSLTYGRPSSFSDYDIDVELPDYDPNNPLWDLYIAWIETAKIQSEIHVKLYSAEATKVSHAERQRAVIALDGRLNDWWTKYGTVLRKRNREPHFVRSYVMTELVFGYHNIMIAIHRVNTVKSQGHEDGNKASDEKSRRGGQEVCAEEDVLKGSVDESEVVCLEHARKGINLVRDTVTQNTSLSGSSWLMWLFSYYPFTAFFILFSNIIRHPNLATSKDDFRLLKFNVDFLESHKDFHAGASKLFPVAQSFLQIAARFVDPASTSVALPTGTKQARSTQQVPHPGKRKLYDTSHQPLLDDDPRGGMPPLPSQEMVMQYPPQPELERTHASFITWSTTSVSSQDHHVPQIITTEAPSSAPYVPAALAAESGTYSFMPTNDISSWPQSGSDAYTWSTNSLGAGMYEAEFQDRVSMAAEEGPFGFDWFGWERWWEAETAGSLAEEGVGVWTGEGEV